MFIVQVVGGLGNQISQYAFSRMLQQQYPDTAVKLDTTPFGEAYPELLSICEANCLRYTLSTKREHLRLKGELPISGSRYPLWKKAINLGLLVYKKRKNIICQEYKSGYPLDSRIFSLDGQKDWFFEGTWHNYNYDDLMPLLRKELQFKFVGEGNKSLLREIQSQTSVSIHVRKGDYVQIGNDIVTWDYYRRAIRIMKERLGWVKFYVFSDDIPVTREFLAQELSAEEVVFVQENTSQNAYMDLYLMQNCKHNIICNSTFSYWAAYLNRSAEKIVIRPRMQTADRETWKVPGWILAEN